MRWGRGKRSRGAKSASSSTALTGASRGGDAELAAEVRAHSATALDTVLSLAHKPGSANMRKLQRAALEAGLAPPTTYLFSAKIATHSLLPLLSVTFAPPPAYLGCCCCGTLTSPSGPWRSGLLLCWGSWVL